jgi:bla regulator protein blaR1
MRRVDYWKSLFVGACSVAVFAQSAPPQAPQTQDWEKAAGGKRAFEVASVKLDSGPSRPSNFPLDVSDAFRPVGDRFFADSSVFTYIGFAYKVGLLSATGAGNAAAAIRKAMQMPEWVFTERYAIEARADGTPTKDQMRLMMQSLLAERFGFQAHFEERTLPAFAI